MILIPQNAKPAVDINHFLSDAQEHFETNHFALIFQYTITLLWIGYLIHKNNIVSPWNLYHLHNTTNYILLFIKRSLFSDRLFYYFALYPSFDLERVPSIYLFVQFSSLLIHTKSSIYNSVLVKEREITFAKCIIMVCCIYRMELRDNVMKWKINICCISGTVLEFLVTKKISIG